ncbi:hypothetical protein GALL_379310 [mine drainage metagenome]|uniref:Uncharacterized protein n=1 Tax=mine drainage metagenome TaxID=410659 RepID=A0A1J5Q9K4_9ZZZZ
MPRANAAARADASAGGEVRGARRDVGGRRLWVKRQLCGRWPGPMPVGRWPTARGRPGGHVCSWGRPCRRCRCACPRAPVTQVDTAAVSRSPRRCRRSWRPGGWTTLEQHRADVARHLCARRQSGEAHGASSLSLRAPRAWPRPRAPTALGGWRVPAAQRQPLACARRLPAVFPPEPRSADSCPARRQGRRRARGQARVEVGCDPIA